MTIPDYLAVAEPIPERSVGDSAAEDLAEVDRLVRDLAALVEAGLVVVEPHVLGPARYGLPAPQFDDAA